MSEWADVMERLVRERRPALVGYAYLLCGSRSDAEEITQEAIVRTFARGRAKTSISQAEAYIKRSIANESVDRVRRRIVAESRRAVLAQSESMAAADYEVAAHADLERALATLAAQERAVVVLRYVDDLSVPQIAATLRLGDGTVKRYLHNAADKLRERLGDDAVYAPDSTERVAVTEGRT